MPSNAWDREQSILGIEAGTPSQWSRKGDMKDVPSHSLVHLVQPAAEMASAEHPDQCPPVQGFSGYHKKPSSVKRHIGNCTKPAWRSSSMVWRLPAELPQLVRALGPKGSQHTRRLSLQRPAYAGHAYLTSSPQTCSAYVHTSEIRRDLLAPVVY